MIWLVGALRLFDFPAQRRMSRWNYSDAKLFAVFLLIVVASRIYQETTRADVVMSERLTTFANDLPGMSGYLFL